MNILSRIDRRPRARARAFAAAVALLALLAAVGLSAPLAAAQVGAPTSTPTPAANGTGAGVAPGAGPEWGPGGGIETGNATTNASGGLLSPQRFMGGVVKWAWNAGTGAVAEGLNYLSQLISGAPAPGVATDPTTWSNPDDGLWPGIWNVTVYFTIPLATVALLLSGGLSFRYESQYRRRAAWRDLALSTFMVVMTWFVAPLGLHLASEFGVWAAPSGTEFLATPGNFGKLATGGLFALILLKFYLAAVVLGTIALGMQYALALVTVAFWPLAWAVRPFGGVARSWGDFWLYLYGLLIGLNVSQAIVLRILFSLPWNSGAVSALLALIITIAGLAFALVYLPVKSLRKASDAAAVGLGTSSANKVSDRVGDAYERAGDVAGDYYGSGRGSGDSESGADHGPDRYGGGHGQYGPASVGGHSSRSASTDGGHDPETSGGATGGGRRMDRERDRIDHMNDDDNFR